MICSYENSGNVIVEFLVKLNNGVDFGVLVKMVVGKDDVWDDVVFF